jgi:hypothetical protein
VVLAAVQDITHHTAATAATSIHMYYEGEVVQTPLASFVGLAGLDGVAVLAPQQGLVEIFPSDGQSLDALPTAVGAAASDGWKVAVLVPSARLGEAHRALRGSPALLQAWWDEGGRICFGGAEVA